MFFGGPSGADGDAFGHSGPALEKRVWVPSSARATLCEMTVRAEIAAKALDKLRRGAPYSVAAVLIAEVAPNGLDGARWHLYVTDGHDSGFVEAQISGTNGGRRGMAVDAAFLEAEVEFISGRFPAKSAFRTCSVLRRSPSRPIGFRRRSEKTEITAFVGFREKIPNPQVTTRPCMPARTPKGARGGSRGAPSQRRRPRH